MTTIVQKAAWYAFLLFVVSLCTMKPIVAVYGQRAAVSDIIFLPVLALVVFGFLTGSMKLRSHAVLIGVILYVATLGVSATFSEDPARSFGKLAAVCYLAAIASVTYHLVDSEQRLRQATYAFLGGATISIIIGLTTLGSFYVVPDTGFVRYFTHHYGMVPVGNFPRLSSTFVSASMFLNYLSVAFVFAVVARYRYGLGRGWFIGVVGTIVVCSVFTVSIGLGAIFLVGGILSALLLKDWSPHFGRAAIFLGSVGALVFLLISPFALQSQPTAAWTISLFNNDLQPSPRLLVWIEAWQKFLQDPITGSGIGLPSASVIFQNTDGTMSRLTDAHNVFLSIASQAGFVGLAGLGPLIWSAAKAGLSGLRGVSLLPSAAFWLTTAFLSAFVYQGLTGSFEDARHIWLVIGLIPAAASFERESQ
ncbi:MAG: O-antigen ligase family protein [Pyrinomonadaceae bacterium]|nr:O-antigen ligase family protein [Pyrinomonadaceae bacterium]